MEKDWYKVEKLEKAQVEENLKYEKGKSIKYRK